MAGSRRLRGGCGCSHLCSVTPSLTPGDPSSGLSQHPRHPGHCAPPLGSGLRFESHRHAGRLPLRPDPPGLPAGCAPLMAFSGVEELLLPRLAPAHKLPFEGGRGGGRRGNTCANGADFLLGPHFPRPFTPAARVDSARRQAPSSGNGKRQSRGRACGLVSGTLSCPPPAVCEREGASSSSPGVL